MKNLILIVLIFIAGFLIGDYQSKCPICEQCFTCEVCLTCEICPLATECPKTFEQELQNCQSMRDNYQSLYSKFQQLDMIMTTTAGAWKFKNTQNKDRYVCYDYSKDFETKWNKAGYDGVMIFGSTPYGRKTGSVGHTRYSVYIDAVTGEFVKVSDDYREEDREYYIK